MFHGSNLFFPSYFGTILDGTEEVIVKHDILEMCTTLEKSFNKSVSEISMCLYHTFGFPKETSRA
jgi:hypothetical protein